MDWGRRALRMQLNVDHGLDTGCSFLATPSSFTTTTNQDAPLLPQTITQRIHMRSQRHGSGKACNLIAASVGSLTVTLLGGGWQKTWDGFEKTRDPQTVACLEHIGKITHVLIVLQEFSYALNCYHRHSVATAHQSAQISKPLASSSPRNSSNNFKSPSQRARQAGACSFPLTAGMKIPRRSRYLGHICHLCDDF